MRIKKLDGAALFLVAPMLLALLPAHGQTAAVTGDQADQDDAALAMNVVVVTANKRSENLQDIAASITAIAGDELERQGLADTSDLQRIIPNLVFGEHFGTTMVVIRGVGSTIDSGVTEPTVAVYSDGVYLPRATMATLRAVDLERVEVLRGPQGSLYGRNATGGAINFISRAPTDFLTGGLNASVESRNGYGISGYASGPLADHIYGRLSGGREKQDGYTKVINTGQRLAGRDVSYVRGALRLEPTPDFSVDASMRYERSDAPNAYQQLLTASPFAAPGQQTTDPNRIVADYPFDQEVTTTISSLGINWDASDNITVRSLTSYIDHSSDQKADGEGTGAALFNLDHYPRDTESFGQEFTVLGDYERFNWILGAFYFHEKAFNDLQFFLGDTGAVLFGLPEGTLFDQAVASNNKSWAAYADGTLSLTDRLRLNLGLRYNEERQRFVQTFFISGVLPAPVNVPLSSDKSKLLPKIALQYHFSDDVNGYVQWSRGFKSGGANLPGSDGALLGGQDAFYLPETIDAYEIGLKSRFYNGALIANFAAYYYDYEGLQVSIVIPPSSTKINNANAKVSGFEAELNWYATDALSLSLAGTYTHARFNQFGGFDDAQGNLFVDLDGKPLPRAPDLTFNIAADYSIPVNNGLLSSIIFHADARYSDDVVLRYFGTANDTQRAYTISNLSVTLTDASEKTRLTAFIDNVFDKVYKQNVAVVLGAYTGNYSEPRTWGLRVSREF